VGKKLTALKAVHDSLREVDNAQVEFGLFRGCLAYNKINHLLRACPPHILAPALRKFDDRFQEMLAEIMRVPSLSEDQWEQASLPVRFAGLGIVQTGAIAGSAYVGSCALTRDLVAAILRRGPEAYAPDRVTEILADHAVATGKTHTFADLAKQPSVQEILSTERHSATFERRKTAATPRARNLLLACSMAHASDWLLCPPIPSLGLSLRSDNFRVALKFRLGVPVYERPFPCPAVSADGKTCREIMDVFGDHALGCRHGPSLVFRHNNVRDILGHAARGAGLAAVVLEKKNLVTGSKSKPGDITVQQYHRGFTSTAFDVTISHPLQLKYISTAMEEGGLAANEAHDRKLQKHLPNCEKEGIQFVPLAWESTGGATETVHETVRRWTEMEAARGGYPAAVIRQTLYGQISCCLQRHLAQAVIDRQPEASCDRALEAPCGPGPRPPFALSPSL
jgi:hypothetical protein